MLLSDWIPCLELSPCGCELGFWVDRTCPSGSPILDIRTCDFDIVKVGLPVCDDKSGLSTFQGIVVNDPEYFVVHFKFKCAVFVDGGSEFIPRIDLGIKSKDDAGPVVWECFDDSGVAENVVDKKEVTGIFLTSVVKCQSDTWGSFLSSTNFARQENE